MNKIRLDRLLLSLHLTTSKSQAKLLIESGQVFCAGQVVKKPGKMVNEKSKIELKGGKTYVSRGAQKIAAAIKRFRINLDNKVIADIGASTGGFTDFVLQHQASKVYAIDVGHDQLAEKLKTNPRVINMEGTNIRDNVELPEEVDLAVCDLSFISLKLVLKSIFDLVKKGGEIITLFKPQFEAGPGVVGKNGVIKDEEVLEKILDNFQDWCKKNNFKLQKIIPSPITGKEGNKEFLIYFKK